MLLIVSHTKINRDYQRVLASNSSSVLFAVAIGAQCSEAHNTLCYEYIRITRIQYHFIVLNVMCTERHTHNASIQTKWITDCVPLWYSYSLHQIELPLSFSQKPSASYDFCKIKNKTIRHFTRFNHFRTVVVLVSVRIVKIGVSRNFRGDFKSL